MDRMQSASMPWEKSLILHKHNVPSIWGEVRCYSPPELFLLFCLIKAIILLSHLLLCLSYWDSEISLKLLTLISLHLPPQCRTTLSLASNSFGDGGLLLPKAVFVIRNWHKASSAFPISHTQLQLRTAWTEFSALAWRWTVLCPITTRLIIPLLRERNRLPC